MLVFVGFGRLLRGDKVVAGHLLVGDVHERRQLLAVDRCRLDGLESGSWLDHVVGRIDRRRVVLPVVEEGVEPGELCLSHAARDKVLLVVGLDLLGDLAHGELEAMLAFNGWPWLVGRAAKKVLGMAVLLHDSVDQGVLPRLLGNHRVDDVRRVDMFIGVALLGGFEQVDRKFTGRGWFEGEDLVHRRLPPWEVVGPGLDMVHKDAGAFALGYRQMKLMTETYRGPRAGRAVSRSRPRRSGGLAPTWPAAALYETRAAPGSAGCCSRAKRAPPWPESSESIPARRFCGLVPMNLGQPGGTVHS